MSLDIINNQKLQLISWIIELEDVDVLNQIKNIQEDNNSFPKWQLDDNEE